MLDISTMMIQLLASCCLETGPRKNHFPSICQIDSHSDTYREFGGVALSCDALKLICGDLMLVTTVIVY